MDKLIEAQEMRKRFLAPLRGSGQPLEGMADAVDGEIQALAQLAIRLDGEKIPARPVVEWAAAQIQLALCGLQPALELRQPATPNDIADAFELFREAAAEVLELYDQATGFILETARSYAEANLGQVEDSRRELERITTAAVQVPADAPEEHLELITAATETSYNRAMGLLELHRGWAKVFPLLFELELKRLRLSMAADLAEVTLPGLSRIQQKYKTVATALRSAPAVTGYLLDKLLEPLGLPGIATELGIVASAVEDAFISERIEQRRDQKLEEYAAEGALILGLVALPNATVQAARVHLAFLVYARDVQEQLRSPQVEKGGT